MLDLLKRSLYPLMLLMVLCTLWSALRLRDLTDEARRGWWPPLEPRPALNISYSVAH